ncbi:MAG TPA: hypothetical protein ENK09_03620 [Nitrospirae bacterium]|nr:hypothetical protein [Nitrospirota bacterium]
MKVLCVVPCGNKKIWDKKPNIGLQKARNVYTGSFATKCKKYAEQFYPSSWVILSAKYGFLFPDDLVPGPYNVSFNDKNTNPITVNELRYQAEEKGLYGYEKIVVVGGKNYTKIIKDVFQNKEIYDPLSDCKGIGYMMGKLNDAIKRGLPL